MFPRRTAAPVFIALFSISLLAGCAAPETEGASTPEPPAANLEAELEDATVPALRYRRLAWTPEMRSRNWLDEVYVPSIGVAFNLETDLDTADGTMNFRPELNAFFADAPVGYSEDLYGEKPAKLEVTEIEVPAELAAAVLEQARLHKALRDSTIALGARVDLAEVLPAVVGSPRWRHVQAE